MSIKEKIVSIVIGLSGVENVKTTDNLQKDIALDSLAMVTMLIEIEEVFEIVLDESDMNPFDLITVQNVIDMVSKYCGDEDE